MWSDDALRQHLAERKRSGLYRQRALLDSGQGPEVVINGQRILSFAANDYLGLADHPDIVAAAKTALDQYGLGSGASHLVAGHSREHHELELELAEFVQRPRALLFSTGYMANLGVITGLLGQGDLVLQDRLNHASLLDGGLSCGAKFRRYPHCDTAALGRALERPGKRKLVVTDGVFSMDGDLAPLPQIAQLAGAANAAVMVDDAHGFGVLGHRGAGIAQYFDLNCSQLPIYVGTFGKAVGTFGAFVAGSDELIETLIQNARTYIYTTALPPAVAAATRASLRVVARADDRRARLADLIKQLRAGAHSLDAELMASDTAIQPLVVGSNERLLAVSNSLWAQGIFAGAIRPPTVPNNTARLRITLTAGHTADHIEKLLEALHRALRANPPEPAQ